MNGIPSLNTDFAAYFVLHLAKLERYEALYRTKNAIQKADFLGIFINGNLANRDFYLPDKISFLA